MQKITPCLWFDSESEAAAKFYTFIFKDSRILSTTNYTADTPSNKPKGSILTVNFQIANQTFTALNGGPFFKINPSISFILNFDPSRDKNAQNQLDALWEKLSEGGKALMPLDKYPFSQRYGWIQDKYGVSWQLILSDPKGKERPLITPSLMFVNKVAGKAEEAIKFYLEVFKDSKMGEINRYPKGMEPDKEGTIMFADFMLEKQWFAAMDSAREHEFSFNEGTSFQVLCANQEEIDYYWEKLSFVPESEQCG